MALRDRFGNIATFKKHLKNTSNEQLFEYIDEIVSPENHSFLNRLIRDQPSIFYIDDRVPFRGKLYAYALADELSRRESEEIKHEVIHKWPGGIGG
jgi:hypothetical protein